MVKFGSSSFCSQLLVAGWLLGIVTVADPAVAQERAATAPDSGSREDNEVGDPDESAKIEEIATMLFELENRRQSLLEGLSPADRERVRLRVVALRKGNPAPATHALEPAGPLPPLVSTPAPTLEPAGDRASARGPTKAGAESGADGRADSQAEKGTEFAENASVVEEPSVTRAAEALADNREEVDRSANRAVDLGRVPDSSAAPACSAWSVFDTNGDGLFSGADRYWRHFFVWLDNGDGIATEDEMKDSFALGIRRLSLGLRSYQGPKQSTGVVERRLNGGRERLRVEILERHRAARGADYGFFAIDIDGLVRGNGPRIRRFTPKKPRGEIVTTGFVLVEQGVEVEVGAGPAGGEEPSGGQWQPLLCPRRVRH